MTGLSPGALGIYGFRNRRDHTHDRLVFSTSRAVTAPRVWERLSDLDGGFQAWARAGLPVCNARRRLRAASY